MIYDKRIVYAIVHKKEQTVAGIRASGSMSIVPALFANKDAAIHHLLHAPQLSKEFKIEQIEIAMGNPRKTTMKPKPKKKIKTSK